MCRGKDRRGKGQKREGAGERRGGRGAFRGGGPCACPPTLEVKKIVLIFM